MTRRAKQAAGFCPRVGWPQRPYMPVSVAFASVWKCRSNPTSAADAEWSFERPAACRHQRRTPLDLIMMRLVACRRTRATVTVATEVGPALDRALGIADFFTSSSCALRQTVRTFAGMLQLPPSATSRFRSERPDRRSRPRSLFGARGRPLQFGAELRRCAEPLEDLLIGDGRAFLDVGALSGSGFALFATSWHRGKAMPNRCKIQTTDFILDLPVRHFCCRRMAASKPFGAGEGNRTLVCSLGSCRSTIELRPRPSSLISRDRAIRQAGCGRQRPPPPPPALNRTARFRMRRFMTVL